jgi:hypothetical protein
VAWHAHGAPPRRNLATIEEQPRSFAGPHTLGTRLIEHTCLACLHSYSIVVDVPSSLIFFVTQGRKTLALALSKHCGSLLSARNTAYQHVQILHT